MALVKCPECGNIIDDRLDACNNCGCPKEYFNENKENIKCPECGESVLFGVEICPNCGFPMDEGFELAKEEKKKAVQEKRRQRALTATKNDGCFFNDIERKEQETLERLVKGEIEFDYDEETSKGIEQTFKVKVAGVTFENRQVKIARLIENGILYIGAKLYLKIEPNNKYDSFAVQVLSSNRIQIGYLPRGVNKEYFLKIQQGVQFDVLVVSIGGGESNYKYGITIEIKEQ